MHHINKDNKLVVKKSHLDYFYSQWKNIKYKHTTETQFRRQTTNKSVKYQLWQNILLYAFEFIKSQTTETGKNQNSITTMHKLRTSKKLVRTQTIPNQCGCTDPKQTKILTV